MYLLLKGVVAYGFLHVLAYVFFESRTGSKIGEYIPREVRHFTLEPALSVVHSTSAFLALIEPWRLIFFSVFATLVFLHVRQLIRKSDRPLFQRILGSLVLTLRKFPFIRGEVEKQMASTRNHLLRSVHGCDKERIFVKELPETGFTTQEIMDRAAKYQAMSEVNVKGGRVSGAIYTDQDNDHMDLLDKVFHMYAYSNPLHPDVFPGCRKMEAEVVRMVANLFHGGPETCGSMTTGGTESIMLAMLAYRNRARAIGISDPEMVVPVTAHAAFDKAAELFGIRIRHVSVTPKNRVKVREMRNCITSDTCVIVGSAPNFPSGTIDNIAEIAKLGEQYGVPVHVDACLGGFLIPFMEEAGFPLQPFDFRLNGVTSISCDTHKYGYCPKGSSIVIYRNSEYIHHQYFCIPDWAGGMYATPTLAGSRCGSAIALTWASLLHFGRKRYVERAQKIIECARQIANAIKGTPEKEGIKGLRLLGSSDVSVVAFTSDVFNIYAVTDRMAALGWNLNTLQNPSAVHICVTYNTALSNCWPDFISDLQKAVDEVLSDPQKAKKSGTAAMYGLAASIPDKTVVSEVAFSYLDSCYAMPSKDEIQ